MSGKKAVQIGQVFELGDVDAHQRHLPIDVRIKLARRVGNAKIAIDPYKALANLCRAPLNLESLIEDGIRLLTGAFSVGVMGGVGPTRSRLTPLGRGHTEPKCARGRRSAPETGLVPGRGTTEAESDRFAELWRTIAAEARARAA